MTVLETLLWAATTALPPGAAPASVAVPTPRWGLTSPSGQPFQTAAVAARGPDGASRTYDGRARQLIVQVPRLDEKVDVDGTLAAPAWQHAARLTGFSGYLPTDGQPAEDSTDVLVWYSPTAIYFGVRAYEAHGPVHATLAKRDNIDADDNVFLIITPFIHGRQALVFGVNPLGVQEDGIMIEGVTGTGYGQATQNGPPPTDLSRDFVYESKGHLTSFGYEVVIRIPFRSIKYQSTDPQDWGLNVVRKVQHSGHSDTWVPTVLAASSFLAQSGTLAGLTGLERGLVLDVNPVVTEKAIGAVGAPPTAGWRYGVERPQFGGNVRWGISNNLTLNGTYRPDFAEVESDATQIVFDPRQAIFYPEKRPFFLDGLEQFNAPNNLIYTRQIQSPLAAAKVTGEVSNFALAYMAAQDFENVSPIGGGHPVFNILRVLRNVGDASQIGLVATDKESGGSFNRVGGLDARFTFGKIYSVGVQGVGSTTRAIGPAASLTGATASGAGPLWQAHFIRAGRTLGLSYDLVGIDPEFVAGSGFIGRTGVVNLNLDHRLTYYTPPGSFLETASLDVLGIDIWKYRRFTAGQSAEDTKLHFTGTATMRGGWQLQASLFVEHFGYDPQLYKGYYLGHVSGTDTTFTPFVGTPKIPNTDYVVSLSTPQFSRFSANIFYLSGRDENFFEWASADVGFTSLTINWRPTDKLRSQLTYNAQFYHRHNDGSLVGRTRIPRLTTEYQLSRPIYFRLIGQYVAAYRDNLRDASRTELPLFFRDPATGAFTRATTFSANQFQVSGLFAYQPVPGTIAFVGYGNILTEPTPFHFLALRRTADNFFVKLSYLFRM